MSYYHYTKGCHLAKIVNEGVIKTAKVSFDKTEKPASWLTKSADWEVACNVGTVANNENLKSGQGCSTDEVNAETVTNSYMKKEIGMCRIVVSEKLPTGSWAKFKHVGGITEQSFELYDKYFKENGSPVNQWVCNFNPIPRKYWEAVEMLVEDQWIRWDEKISIERFYDLCMSCNNPNYKPIMVYPEHYYREAEFLDKYREEIIQFWEINKNRKGYIQIYITPDYHPYECGFQFIEKSVKKSAFTVSTESSTNNYALVHFLWEATYTQYKAAIAC